MSLRPSGGALVVAGVLVAAGCGGHGSSGDKRAANLVPWTAAVPAQLRAGDAASAPRCRASQLRVEGKGFVFTAAVAGGTGTATLRNAGSRPCRLTGRPVVRFVGAPRGPRQLQVPLPPRAPAFPDVAPPAATLSACRPAARPSSASTGATGAFRVPRARADGCAHRARCV